MTKISRKAAREILTNGVYRLYIGCPCGCDRYTTNAGYRYNGDWVGATKSEAVDNAILALWHI